MTKQFHNFTKPQRLGGANDFYDPSPITRAGTKSSWLRTTIQLAFYNEPKEEAKELPFPILIWLMYFNAHTNATVRPQRPLNEDRTGG